MSVGTAQLGLRRNCGQFTLLVIVNAFEGGMVGIKSVHDNGPH